MKVKWAEFNSEGYAHACRLFHDEVKMRDFTEYHMGEVIDIFVAHNEPWLLVKEENRLVATKATDCEVIED
jgi:hypothetical protein